MVMNCNFLTLLIATSLIFAAAQNSKIPQDKNLKENVKSGVKEVTKSKNGPYNNKTAINNASGQDKNKTDISAHSGKRNPSASQGKFNNPNLKQQPQFQKQMQNSKNNQGRNINNNNEKPGQIKYKTTLVPEVVTKNEFGYSKFQPNLRSGQKQFSTHKNIKNKYNTVNPLQYRGLNSGSKKSDISEYVETPPPKKIKTKSLRQNKPCTKLTCLMLYDVFAKEVYDQPQYQSGSVKIIIKNLNIGSNNPTPNNENPEMMRELLRKLDSQMTTPYPYGSTNYVYNDLSSRMEGINGRLEQLMRDQENLRNQQQYTTTVTPTYTTEMYSTTTENNNDLGNLIERMRLMQFLQATTPQEEINNSGNVMNNNFGFIPNTGGSSFPFGIIAESVESYTGDDYDAIRQKTSTANPFTTEENLSWNTSTTGDDNILAILLNGTERHNAEFPLFLIPLDTIGRENNNNNFHTGTTPKYDFNIILTTPTPFSQLEIISLPPSSISNSAQFGNSFPRGGHNGNQFSNNSSNFGSMFSMFG